MVSEKVEIFLDGSNFYNGLMKQFGSCQYDIKRLVDKLTRDRNLVAICNEDSSLYPIGIE
jgi:hypothetical protein